jgi:hypothetical protein
MEMYTEKICPYCSQTIKFGEEAVNCSGCGKPHHKDCWEKNGGCTTYQCEGKPIALSSSKGVETGGNSIRYCSQCGASNQTNFSYCQKCGSPLGSGSRPAYNQQYSYNNYQNNNNYDEGLSGEEKVLIFLGNICLSQLLGIILYFVWKDSKPKKSNDVCKITLWSIAVPFIITIVFIIIMAIGSAGY